METTAPHISIRLATDADQPSLVQLAALDSAPQPTGPVLVADMCGEIVAARPLAQQRTIADPFRRTADARELLELRARQLPPESSHPWRHPLHRRRVVRSALAA
jgi:hypothetical protein